MRIVTILAALCALSPAQAASPADWARRCDAVGHFAALAAAARDDGKPAGEASLTGRRLLGHPDILAPDVADEIARQVYGTSDLAPGEEAALMRGKCLTPVEAGASAPGPFAGPLSPIRLKVGTNHIATPDGGVDVTLAWKDDGEGRGHDVFTATAPGAGSVSMPGGLSVADDPADDQGMRRSVRFARGRMRGEDTILLLIAQREPGLGATSTTYQVRRLARDPGGWRFAPLAEARLPARYCNADAALSAASGLAPRASYRGPPTADGCPAR